MSTAAGVVVRALRQGVAIVEQRLSWTGQVHRGRCLIGEEHLLSRPGWGLPSCEAGRAGPRCPFALGKPAGPSPVDRRRETPPLSPPGSRDQEHCLHPPLTVGDPTLRTGRAEPRHFGRPPTRAMMRTPQRTRFPPHHQATSPWPAPTFHFSVSCPTRAPPTPKPTRANTRGLRMSPTCPRSGVLCDIAVCGGPAALGRRGR